MIALFTENGPLRVAQDLKVTIDEYSWIKEANMLFIDQPVGVGFSIGDQPVSNEDELAKDMVEFMRGFYEVHQDLSDIDLFLSGESYCGRYIPHISKAFVDNKDFIPIKAIILGNAIIDLAVQRSHIGDIAFEAGYLT